MKKITKITAALFMAAATLLAISCKEPEVEEQIPEDAVRNWTASSKESNWSVYNVADLEKLSEFVNAGNDFTGKTITVKNDIVINKKVLTAYFEEPAEGEEAGTPNPNLKNLDSIGIGVTPDGGDITPFCGTFDGNGKVISGLYMYQGHQGLGLFGVVDGATIKNVILVDACVINKNVWEGVKEDGVTPTHDGKDDDRFGGLIGIVDGEGATIENCLFAGVVGSQAAVDRGSPYEYIGGLIGRADAEATVSDSFVFARFYGSREDKADFVCGRYPERLKRTNINGEDNKGVEVKTYDEDVAAAIEDAINAVKANVQ